MTDQVENSLTHFHSVDAHSRFEMKWILWVKCDWILLWMSFELAFKVLLLQYDCESWCHCCHPWSYAKINWTWDGKWHWWVVWHFCFYRHWRILQGLLLRGLGQNLFLRWVCSDVLLQVWRVQMSCSWDCGPVDHWVWQFSELDRYWRTSIAGFTFLFTWQLIVAGKVNIHRAA